MTSVTLKLMNQPYMGLNHHTLPFHLQTSTSALSSLHNSDVPFRKPCACHILHNDFLGTHVGYSIKHPLRTPPCDHSIPILTSIRVSYIYHCTKRFILNEAFPLFLQDSIMNACHRGCRLYSICQFVNGNTGINTSKEECQGGINYFDQFWEISN